MEDSLGIFQKYLIKYFSMLLVVENELPTNHETHLNIGISKT
jgi:hypothetical protein